VNAPGDRGEAEPPSPTPAHGTQRCRDGVTGLDATRGRSRTSKDVHVTAACPLRMKSRGGHSEAKVSRLVPPTKKFRQRSAGPLYEFAEKWMATHQPGNPVLVHPRRTRSTTRVPRSCTFISVDGCVV
jgi:hypothetical protein